MFDKTQAEANLKLVSDIQKNMAAVVQKMTAILNDVAIQAKVNEFQKLI